MLHFQC